MKGRKYAFRVVCLGKSKERCLPALPAKQTHVVPWADARHKKGRYVGWIDQKGSGGDHEILNLRSKSEVATYETEFCPHWGTYIWMFLVEKSLRNPQKYLMRSAQRFNGSTVAKSRSPHAVKLELSYLLPPHPISESASQQPWRILLSQLKVSFWWKRSWQS